MVTITKETIIGDILDIAPQTAPLFMAIGMHCLGCPASRGETVEEACMVHGIDTDELLEELNKQISSRRCTVNWFYEIAPRVTLPQQWWFSGGAIFVFGAV